MRYVTAGGMVYNVSGCGWLVFYYFITGWYTQGVSYTTSRVVYTVLYTDGSTSSTGDSSDGSSSVILLCTSSF